MSSLKAYPCPSYAQRIKIALHYLLPQQPITRLAGWLAEKKWGIVSHTIIRLFAKQYRVNLAEAELENASDYENFNAFFIRKLKADARPIVAEANQLAFPADGHISEFGRIHAGRLLQAKGHEFSLSALLAEDQDLAEKFHDGHFITTYLSPSDYHRVHMPCAARLRKMIYVPGELFSVNPFLARHVPDLFARNERVICVFETELGTMVQILVGATITASISTTWAGVINPPRYEAVKVWEYEDAEIAFEKGQEMGAFRLGSTVINLFEPNAITFVDDLAVGKQTRMGALMATQNA